MKSNRLLVIFVCGLLLLTGCKEKTNPLREAIVDKVKETNPDVEYFNVSRLETVSAITLDNELARRRGIFESKVKAYDRKARDFRRKGMQVNAADMTAKSREAADVVERFVAYRDDHSAQLDSVLYFVMKMDGFGYTSARMKIDVKGYYVTIGANGKVITILPPDGNPVQGMGVMIPNYKTEILNSVPENDSE